MKLLKSIDEIYEEVKDYDLVITNDVALETALNARIATPRIGTLAITPRHIAKITGERVLGDRFLTELELISAVSAASDCSFRQVCSEIINIREIRRHTAEVEENLAGRAAKKICRWYSKMPTLENAMSATEPADIEWYFEEDGRKLRVAVIGVELFNDLDKHFIPEDLDFVDFIDIFKDGDFGIDTIHVIGNDRQLAENAVDLIDKEHPEDFAIVLCSDQPIADAVRSSLYRRDMPFVNALAVSDLAQIRDYISFVGLSFEYRTLRVRDIAEIFSTHNGSIERGTENYLLCRQGPKMKGRNRDLYELMERICTGEATFGDVKDRLCSKMNRSTVTTVLKELGIENSKITPGGLADMRFAVEMVQDLKHNEQILDNERTGVLLADCKNSVFVDRPVVIYLGLDDDWTIPVAGRRYLDGQAEAELNADRLTALIQQGQRRVYCVNRAKRGRDAVPSQMFDIAMGAPVKDFASICSRIEEGDWADGVLERESPAVLMMGEEDVDKAVMNYAGEHLFSKTSFNAYAACPRKYMFHGLLTSEDNTYTAFGSVIHEFAELYACYPDIVVETGIDELVDMVAGEYAGISSPSMTEVDRSKIRRAMENIVLYIDGLRLHLELDDADGSGHDDNRFMERLGLVGRSNSCERDRPSSKHRIHGKFDLFSDGVVTDYKTGKMHDAKKIRAKMNFDEIDELPEFQPLIYLALASEPGGTDVEFRQFYALGNDVNSMNENFDIRNNVISISMCPSGFDQVFTDERVESYRSILSMVMAPHARTIVDAVSGYGDLHGRWKEDEKLVKAVVDKIGQKKITAEFVKTALKYLQDMFDGHFLALGGDIKVTESALAEFLDRLDAMHADAMRGRYTELPAEPQAAVNCRKCEYFEVCTGARLAIDDGGDSDERSQ